MKNTFTLDMSAIAFVAVVHTIGGIGLGMWLTQYTPVRSRRGLALTLMALGGAFHVPMRRAVMRGRDQKAVGA